MLQNTSRAARAHTKQTTREQQQAEKHPARRPPGIAHDCVRAQLNPLCPFVSGGQLPLYSSKCINPALESYRGAALLRAGLDQEETLIVVVSKTFTTAETMLNARTVRAWLTAKLGNEAIPKHMVAVSTNKKLVKQFGIDTANMFGFWDWVGGRYSVCSAVGILPLALQYGFPQCELFLEGAHSMDEHFRTAPFEDNLPVMMGLFSLWNSTFLGYSSRAILPYCQALSKLPPHIQQV